MPFSTTIDKLVICEPGRSRSTAYVGVSHPTPAEEQMLGKLVLLCELESNDAVNLDIIHELERELTESYYGSDELNPEIAFEQALAKVNQKVADLVADYAKNWHETLHIAALVLHGEYIHLADYGRLHAFLIHQDKITDILSSTPRLHDTPSALKIFTNVVSGKIQAGDYLLLSTTSLLDYFSQEKLRRMIIEHPPRETVGRIETILAENINQSAFAVVLLHQNVEKRVIPVNPMTPTMPLRRGEYSAPQTSMDRLIERQATTQEFLSPSLWNNAKKSLGGKLEGWAVLLKTKVLRQSSRRVRLQTDVKDYGHQWKPSGDQVTGSLLRSVGRAVQTMFHWIRSLMLSVIRLVRKTKDAPRPLATAPLHIASLPSRLIHFVKRLPRTSQILLALALVIVFIFSQSIVTQGVQKATENSQEHYATVVSDIRRLLVEAESSLSYGNYPAAVEAVQQSSDLLSTLSSGDDDQEQERSELQRTINALRERTSRLTRIDTPTVRADLSALSGSSDIAGMTGIGQELFAFTASENQLFKIPASGEPELYAQAAAAPGFQYATLSTGNTILFLNTSNGLNEFTVNAKALRDISFSLASTSANIIDIRHYQGRLYLLDIGDGQILRAVRSGNAYGTASSWLQSSAGFQGARSFAIDGSIYVLFADGEVKKYTRGVEDSFTLEAVEPALTSGTRLWTDEESDNVYILDASSRRLLIFTKEGTLVNQYTSDAFDALRDFTIDDAEQNAYLLNGTRIYTVPLQ